MNPPGSIWDTDLFCKVYYRDLIDIHLDEQQKNSYSYFEGLFHQAFLLARKKEFEASNALFEKGEAELSAYDSKSIFGMLLQESRYPKKAYYYYKVNNFKTASYLTFKTIAANEYLKINLEAGFLVFVQVQQYHNISRILCRMNEHQSAIILNNNLLYFLIYNQPSSLKPLKTIIHEDNTERSTLVCAMAYQIILDTLLSIYNLPSGKVQTDQLDAFANFITVLSLTFNPVNEQEWILLDFFRLLPYLNLNDLATYEQKLDIFLTNHTDLFPLTEKILKIFLPQPASYNNKFQFK